MVNRRLGMGKIKEIIRLHESGLSYRKIAAALAISRPVVSQYIIDYSKSGLKYDYIKNLADTMLLDMLGKKKQECQKYKELLEDFSYYTKELKRKGVTLNLLWAEYIEKYPNGYKYSQFCYHYQIWRSLDNVTMHIEHKAGDKCFIDFTGQTIPIVNRITGEIKTCEIFVAILGASERTYAEAVESKTKENLIYATENAFIYFGGVTSALVPDGLKSAVTNANKWEPDLNPEYYKFAEYYGTVILPARARKPKDKDYASYCTSPLRLNF